MTLRTCVVMMIPAVQARSDIDDFVLPARFYVYVIGEIMSDNVKFGASCSLHYELARNGSEGQ